MNDQVDFPKLRRHVRYIFMAIIGLLLLFFVLAQIVF